MKGYLENTGDARVRCLRVESPNVCQPWVRCHISKPGEGEADMEVAVRTQRRTCRVGMVRYGTTIFICHMFQNFVVVVV